MTDDEMIDLFDALQPEFESRLSDLSYGYVEGLYDGGEIEAAILMGIRSAASENAALPMDLVLRAAPMYTAGDNRILYVDAATKLANIEFAAAS